MSAKSILNQFLLENEEIEASEGNDVKRNSRNIKESLNQSDITKSVGGIIVIGGCNDWDNSTSKSPEGYYCYYNFFITNYYITDFFNSF